ncbi:hypothetical protein K491DRAFT_89904 [Lophiostoma macrostomum CBS 122681]|uniref:Indole-diterpene biosynthesis protein-like protein PaxU n=1 Tax=Lophiostoma macrostomum CBS 122681 TaxID=1314788 RepID=A0A6A6SV53_9PLEO|nr:hypothetical protein K491DRAFT_89904 [Lophiostoma macrostomum CBS 122681]
MTGTKQSAIIPGFTCVAPSIWERLPVLHSRFRWEKSNESPKAPDLILLFTWTGAHGRHILKHADTYQSLFPSSTIMIITTSIKDLWFRNSRSQPRRLRPAINRILAYKHIDNILVHAYSEGGSNKVVEFADAYRVETGVRLPCTALLLDSTPGHPRYLRLCNAARLSLPSIPILGVLGFGICVVVLGIFWILYRCIKGWENNFISRTRRKLLDDTIWDLTVPRCYFFSQADELIWWKDVLQHARESIEMGVPVLHVCFQRSAHCRHAADYPISYWDAVAMTWKRASDTAALLRKKQSITWPLEAAVRTGYKSTISESGSECTLTV